MLHVSTILSGHNQALQSTIQVIKLLVIIRIRVAATDSLRCQGIYVYLYFIYGHV
jgi:hypothetical protein